MITKTFRLRLTALYTSVVILIFSLFALVIYLKYKDDLFTTIDKYLISEARTEVVNEVDVTRLPRGGVVLRKYGDEYFEIIDQKGEVLITSLSQGKSDRWPLNRELMVNAFNGIQAFETIDFNGERFRVLYFPVSEDMVLRIGQSLREVEKAIVRLKRLLLYAFPFIFSVSVVTSWVLAGQSLSPIVKIKTLAENIRKGHLGERINIGLKGKEIDDLVTIFNDMLDSIQRSVETQKRFTADVSHEIRSPLTSLRGNIEVALRKKRTPEEYEQVLENNLADIMRLSKITDNLLFLTRADNRIQEVRKTWFNIRQFLEKIVDHLRQKSADACLVISQEYEDDIEFYGDTDLLEQAISNIIENAIKYTPAGGSISIRAERQYDYLFIIIRDNGIGIPPEEIPHIFDRFYRVNKERSRKSGGTGLGLSIAQWIIEEHKGKVLVKSTVGSGTEFTVVLPRKPS